MKNKLIILVVLLLFITINNYSQTKQKTTKQKSLVTFIELGSMRCIPCQKMQVVMKSVEEKFGSQLNTIFYDVWTKDGKPYAETYKINLIPTQIFLDKNGKEYFRHEGYFPEQDLIKILKKQGVK
jgi:thioredoxin 1